MLQTKETEAEWMQKQDPYICCLQATHFRSRDIYRHKVREQKTRYSMQIESKESQGSKTRIR